MNKLPSVLNNDKRLEYLLRAEYEVNNTLSVSATL